MKRILSLVLAMVMVLGSFGAVFAEDTTLAEEAVEVLMDLGVLTEGKLEQDFKRQDAIVLLSRLFGVEETAKDFPAEDLTFEDVVDPFYEGYIAWAVAQELTDGKSETKFGFDDKLKTQELAMFLLRALGYGDVDFDDALEEAQELGLLLNVADDAIVKRGDMALMTLNALATPMKDSETTLAEHLELVLPEEPAPAVLEVENVSASNLKQIFVEFNQEVDEDSATNLKNYTFALDLEDAMLLEDGKTVVITLKEGTTVLTSQKEYKLTINNVENVAETTKLGKVEHLFTAIDTTLPAVKDVVALGTKAIKVVFSEPVKELTANSTMRYKIDDKMVSGYVKYVYPNEAIITTTVAVGDHVLKVTDVEDFAGFKVQEPGFNFTVVEDNEAPQIVSAKTVDLNKVVVEFNEPVKAIASASHTTKGSGAKSITIAGNKATIVFNTKMSLTDTTIYINGVQDYSDNKADRSFVVTPELDLSRPEVAEVKVTKDTHGTKFVIKFTKTVKNTVKENFVIKKADGTLLNANGLYNGNPIVPITPNGNDTQTDTATFTTSAHLAKGSYTLEISGVRDIATIENIMLPYLHSFEVKDSATPDISKAWKEGNATDGYKVYVQFTKDMALEGKGSILDVVKYSYATDNTSPYNYKPVPVGTTVDLLTPNTVRLNLAKDGAAYTNPQAIRVSLVTDLSENWITDGINQLMADKQITTNTVTIDEVVLVAEDKLEVTFESKLININPSDFAVGNSVYSNLTLEQFEYDGNNTIASFKIASGHELGNVQNPGQFFVKPNSTSTDEFGVKLDNAGLTENIVDGIAPTVVDYGLKLNGSVITVDFDEALGAVVNAPAVISVTVNGKATPVASISTVGNTLTITLISAPDTNNTAITVTLDGDLNKAIEAVTDLQGNLAKPFTKVILNGVDPK